MTTVGRSAWTTAGGTTPYYTLTKPVNVGQPAVQNATLDTGANDYRAVNYGVKDIQRRIIALGYTEKMATDGWYGFYTDKGVRWAQQHLGLTADGEIGPVTMKALLKPVVEQLEAKYQIPNHFIGGLIAWESNFDPGAVGYSTPLDKGLAQFHVDGGQTWWWTHFGKPEQPITLDNAFAYHWAIENAAARMASARVKYSGKGAELQDECSIAQHNAPAWADQWFADGVAPNQTIADYVKNVMARASSF